MKKNTRKPRSAYGMSCVHYTISGKRYIHVSQVKNCEASEVRSMADWLVRAADWMEARE